MSLLSTIFMLIRISTLSIVHAILHRHLTTCRKYRLKICENKYTYPDVTQTSLSFFGEDCWYISIRTCIIRLFCLVNLLSILIHFMLQRCEIVIKILRLDSSSRDGIDKRQPFIYSTVDRHRRVTCKEAFSWWPIAFDYNVDRFNSLKALVPPST